jgi:GNAT superfamily N-acetyltransferase
MTLTIRPATAADLPSLIAGNTALALESEGKTLSEPTLRAGLEATLADPHKGFYTVAEAEGRVVGHMLVTFEFSDWRNGFYWWVQSVYVWPEFRRAGIFRRIFEHVKERAIANPGVIGLRLYVERDNLRAQQTYTALGLEEEPYFLFGQYPLPGRSSSIA